MQIALACSLLLVGRPKLKKSSKLSFPLRFKDLGLDHGFQTEARGGEPPLQGFYLEDALGGMPSASENGSEELLVSDSLGGKGL